MSVTCDCEKCKYNEWGMCDKENELGGITLDEKGRCVDREEVDKDV